MKQWGWNPPNTPYPINIDFLQLNSPINELPGQKEMVISSSPRYSNGNFKIGKLGANIALRYFLWEGSRAMGSLLLLNVQLLLLNVQVEFMPYTVRQQKQIMKKS